MKPLREFGLVVAADGQRGAGAIDGQHLDIAGVERGVDQDRGGGEDLASFDRDSIARLAGKPANSARAMRGARTSAEAAAEPLFRHFPPPFPQRLPRGAIAQDHAQPVASTRRGPPMLKPSPMPKLLCRPPVAPPSPRLTGPLPPPRSCVWRCVHFGHHVRRAGVAAPGPTRPVRAAPPAARAGPPGFADRPQHHHSPKPPPPRRAQPGHRIGRGKASHLHRRGQDGAWNCRRGASRGAAVSMAKAKWRMGCASSESRAMRSSPREIGMPRRPLEAGVRAVSPQSGWRRPGH
jgi:hypothetical protein